MTKHLRTFGMEHKAGVRTRQDARLYRGTRTQSCIVGSLEAPITLTACLGEESGVPGGHRRRAQSMNY